MYKNMMEIMVEETFDTMISELDCCTCELCRSDIVAYALNHLPPMYAVSDSGRVISKLYATQAQHMLEIQIELAKAARLVKSHPRH